MILVMNRRAGEIASEDVVARFDLNGDPMAPWCKAAQAAGVQLEGVTLEVWDTGADQRTEGIHCFTIRNAAHVLNPPVQRDENGQPRRGRPRKAP